MEELVKGGFGTLIFIILVFIAIFLLTREFWCWYWKINNRLNTLESIDRRLADIQRLLAQGNTVNAIMTGEISNIAASINSTKMEQEEDSEDDLPDL